MQGTKIARSPFHHFGFHQDVQKTLRRQFSRPFNPSSPLILNNSVELPPDSRTDDVQRFFEQEAGTKVVDCRVMTGIVHSSSSSMALHSLTQSLGFGFIEFETTEVLYITLSPCYAPPDPLTRTRKTLFAWTVMTLKVIQSWSSLQRRTGPAESPLAISVQGERLSSPSNHPFKTQLDVSGRRPGVPVIITNVSRDVSWQVSRPSPCPWISYSWPSARSFGLVLSGGLRQ